jgi:lipopolysaccharide/colanic/teichoic acid biosynthesis glycosyltransferase
MTLIKKTALFILIDLFIVSLVFGILIWIKPGTFRYYIPHHTTPFLFFLAIWFLTSIFTGKYQIPESRDLKKSLLRVVIGNFVLLSLVTIAIYGFQLFQFSRLIVFGTIFFSTLLEMLFVYIYHNNLHRSRRNEYYQPYPPEEAGLVATAYPTPEVRKEGIPEPELPALSDANRNLIVQESGQEVSGFINDFIRKDHAPALLLSTTTEFNIINQPDDHFRSIINLKLINDIKRVNKFFEAVNVKLPPGGLFAGSVLTNEIKKARILRKNPVIVNYLIYSFYFLFRRIFPKLPLTKQIYFLITNGYDRALSKAETFGRLYCCGFELLGAHQIGDVLYFVAQKTKEPAFDLNPTYGPLIRLKRIGRKGKIITVYKFRTMHPYAEYIQDYVFRSNALEEGGKFRDDFRVTTIGKFMRRFWLDEPPMLFSVLKGDIKIVGVRPISQHYYSLYSDELREKRIRFRPGLIPPFYADLPKTLQEIMVSEMKYLEQFEKRPFLTDLKYFFKALYNILFKKARSN